MYTTKAIVCGSRDNMTSDKSYLLFTEDIGMLWATAKSVRMEKSKQRHALQDFSIIRISLVQGRSTWRIGSVEAIANPFLAADSRMSRAGVSFVVKAIRRYVHGEVVVPEIFSDTEESLLSLSSEDDIGTIERYQQLYMLRLLSRLGYVVRTEALASSLDTPSIAAAVENHDVTIDAMVSKSIEHAAHASHL